MGVDRILALAEEDDRSEQSLELRGLPLFVALYAGLFLAHFWLIPEFTFH